MKMKDNKGVTLVELILAIAILGMVAVSILPMFSSGFTHIARAGQRTEVTFINHREIEKELNSNNQNLSGDSIEIEFYDSTEIEAKGSQKEEVQSISGVEVELYFFHPQY